VVRIDAEDQKLELTVSGRTESKKDDDLRTGFDSWFCFTRLALVEPTISKLLEFPRRESASELLAYPFRSYMLSDALLCK
jgi:hypothetical protein